MNLTRLARAALVFEVKRHCWDALPGAKKSCQEQRPAGSTDLCSMWGRLDIARELVRWAALQQSKTSSGGRTVFTRWVKSIAEMSGYSGICRDRNTSWIYEAGRSDGSCSDRYA
jgi:hypothetical protein